MMQNVLQKIHWFIKEWIRPVSLSTLAKSDRVIESAKFFTAFYYGVIPILAYRFMTGNQQDRVNFDPLWPIEWVKIFDLEVGETVALFKLGFITVSLFGALFFKHFWVRLLVFFAILHVHALESSFSHINHQWYTWLYSSAILLFLPNIWVNTSFEIRRKFLLQIWFAQAMVLLTYFMAGLHKIYAVIIQWSAGEIHGLHMLAFSYQSANWVQQLQEPALLASSIINYPEWWWLPYITLYLVQIFALWIMVRTSLHKLWGFSILVFHFGTYLTMGITFPEQFILVVVLLFFTPFAPEKPTVKRILIDLPVIGQLYEYSLRKRGLWERNREELTRT